MTINQPKPTTCDRCDQHFPSINKYRKHDCPKKPKRIPDLTYVLTDTKTSLSTVLLKDYEDLVEVKVEIDFPTGELIIKDFYNRSIKQIFSFSVGNDASNSVPLNKWEKNFDWAVEFYEILESYMSINNVYLTTVGEEIMVDIKLVNLFNELESFTIDWRRYNQNFFPHRDMAYPVYHLRRSMDRLGEFDNISKDKLLYSVDHVVNWFTNKIEMIDVHRLDRTEQVDLDAKYRDYDEVENWVVSDHTGKYLVIAAKHY